MLKTMKNQMLPERGEGGRCKGKTPKTFMYVCMRRCSLKCLSRYNLKYNMNLPVFEIQTTIMFVTPFQLRQIFR